MNDLKHCPSRLTEGYTTYSPIALTRLFGGKKVSHILPYQSPTSPNDRLPFNQNQKHISLSGFQEKHSLILDGTTLRLTDINERGEFILKPISEMPKNKEFAPANEQLTMQIANQIFKIETAENALIFFKNGEPAYLTKRFDINEKGNKLAVEDFASLLQKSPATHGDNYKYTGNYLELFEVMKKHVPAWRVEVPKLFELITFNYLFGNGDAHLKNYSLIETLQGDFKLSPAYDLLNTKLHIDDADWALQDGLLPKNIRTGGIKTQLLTLAEKVEIPSKSTLKILDNLTDHENDVIGMVRRSFLSEQLQRNYIQSYQRRLKKLRK